MMLLRRIAQYSLVLPSMFYKNVILRISNLGTNYLVFKQNPWCSGSLASSECRQSKLCCATVITMKNFQCSVLKNRITWSFHLFYTSRVCSTRQLSLFKKQSLNCIETQLYPWLFKHTLQKAGFITFKSLSKIFSPIYKKWILSLLPWNVFKYKNYFFLAFGPTFLLY